MKTKHKLSLAVVIGVTSLFGSAFGDTTKFLPVADAMMFASSGFTPSGNAAGRGPGLFAGADGMSERKRSLVRWDLTQMTPYSGSAIGSNAIIDSVEIDMTIGQIAGSGGGNGAGSPPGEDGGGCGTTCSPMERTFTFYPVTTTWNEGSTGTGQCAGHTYCVTMSGTGHGWSAVSGDVTWEYTNWMTTQWSNHASADQDYGSAFEAETFNNFTFQRTLAWTGSGAMNPFVVQVKSWLTTPANNKGMIIKSGDEGTATSFIGFWSRDAAGEAMNFAIAPQLIVNYHY